MPSRKQRRRREKTFRHEWETVLLDDEGNEIPLDADELRAQREEKERERTAARSPRGKDAKKQPRGARGAARPPRVVAPPSWQRAMKRGGMMGGLMLVVSAVLLHNVVIGLFYAVMFIPLTYWIDRLAYRSYQRRLAAAGTRSDRK